jgi:hypothetical protein
VLVGLQSRHSQSSGAPGPVIVPEPACVLLGAEEALELIVVVASEGLLRGFVSDCLVI